MTRLSLLGVVALVLAGLGLYVVTEKPEVYERIRYPLRYEQIVTGHAKNYGLEPELVAAVIYQESKFDADAVSSSGAVGLMQLLPATAQGIADRTGGSGWQERDLLDPELNVRYGAGTSPPAEEVRLRGARARGVQRRSGERRPLARRGVGIMFPETRHYVERVRELKAIYARAYSSELGL